MAEEEIEISELEFEEDLAGDLVFPVESASDTKATSLTVLKNWLKQFFVGLSDDEIITGLKNFSRSDGVQIALTASHIDASSAPASSQYAGINVYDKNGHRIGKFECSQRSDGSFETIINATNLDGNNGQIAVAIAPNGTVSTRAPTPASSDNTTKIATTAFVKSVLSSSGNGLATISKARSGYCQFTNGLIVQWGYSSSFGTDSTITFPKSFSSATSYTVLASPISSTAYGYPTYMKAQTATNCTGRRNDGNKPATQWLAIGY